MWLWKKFWNIDIIGKIYILIVLFIAVVATITVITRYKNSNTNQIENEPKNEIIGKEITSESNTIDNNVITVANIKGDTKDTTKQNIDAKEQEKTTTDKNNTKLSNKTAKKEATNKTSKTQEQKENVQENKKEEVKQNNNKSVQTEEYKINNNMINKMKQTIDKNKTEDMIEFGYNIIVDSSIVTKTNYFTYTDKRLISKLTYRFGAIRIYARDLYINKEYAHTECFIY